MISLRALVFFLLFWVSDGYAAIQKLPLPRFAALRATKVNLHVGPGVDFPVEWTFQRQGLPVEIIAEFDTWRQIRDKEGTTGWVHKSMLTGKRTALILSREKQRPSEKKQAGGIVKENVAVDDQVPAGKNVMRRRAAEDAPIVAHVEQGVITRLKQCKGEWCRVSVKGYDGWIQRTDLWGVYLDEEKF